VFCVQITKNPPADAGNETLLNHSLKNIRRIPQVPSAKPIPASNMRSHGSLTSLRKPMEIANSTSAATSLIIFGANL
jgi:hypothetical protein